MEKTTRERERKTYVNTYTEHVRHVGLSAEFPLPAPDSVVHVNQTLVDILQIFFKLLLK